MPVDIPNLELKDGNEIPQLGLGTYTLKGDECRRAVGAALDLGYRHVDTAERYGNESEIGEVIGAHDRSDLFLTSKVWPTNLRYEDVKESCEGSLERLDTSYLDLYLVHWPNEDVPMEETFGAMEELREEGRVRSVGVSNFTIGQLREAMEASEVPITVNQVEFHPWLYQEDLLEFCDQNGVKITAYSPLARARFFGEGIVEELSEKYGRTGAQVVLRWEVQKGLVAIPRSGSRGHLDDNLEIFDWELEPEDIERIDRIDAMERLVNFHYSSF